jgi:hypothetical protein
MCVDDSVMCVSVMDVCDVRCDGVMMCVEGRCVDDDTCVGPI